MPYTPLGQSLTLSVSSAGESVALPGNAPQCRVYNKGPNACFVKYGVGSVVADSSDFVMPAGFMEVHTKNNATILAAKCANGETATLHISPGSGD